MSYYTPEFMKHRSANSFGTKLVEYLELTIVNSGKPFCSESDMIKLLKTMSQKEIDNICINEAYINSKI